MLKEKYKKSSFLRYVFRKQINKVIVKNLKKLCNKIEKEYDYSRNDFPDIKNMKAILLKMNLNKIKIYNRKLFTNKDSFNNVDIPTLIERLVLL